MRGSLPSLHDEHNAHWHIQRRPCPLPSPPTLPARSCANPRGKQLARSFPPFDPDARAPARPTATQDPQPSSPPTTPLSPADASNGSPPESASAAPAAEPAPDPPAPTAADAAAQQIYHVQRSLPVFSPTRVYSPLLVPFVFLQIFPQVLRHALTPILDHVTSMEQWKRTNRRMKLELAIAEDPGNPALFATYMNELNTSNPHDAVLTFCSGKFASNSEEAVKEFIKALVHSGRLDQYGGAYEVADTSDHLSLPKLLAELSIQAQGDIAPENLGAASSSPMYVHVLNGERAGNALVRGAQWLLGNTVLIALMVVSFVAGSEIVRQISQSSTTQQSGTAGTSASSSATTATAPKEYSRDNLPEKSVKKFSDVKGCDEAKEELVEIVQYLKKPEKFRKLGAKLPKGVLLTGSPGTGKTLLARAVAGEAEVPFFYRAGSEFEEMFVGVGARRVRALFQAAKSKAPCIVFVDEIDAIGGHRKQWDTYKKTLNQFLTEMDGFEENSGVIVIAATNLPETLDPALTRPGRFDRHVAVNLPDINGRREIVEHYLKDKPVSEDVEADKIARQTPGFSGAQLFNLVNEAALMAAKAGHDVISNGMVDEARDKIIMGKQRSKLAQSEDARKMTAYHEAGHAVVALYTSGAKSIHKATIVPRGHALGMVSQLAEDEYQTTRQQLIADIDVCMGGKVAEEVVFGADKATTGVSSDLRRATSLARHMVMNCGMSDSIGPLYIDGSSSADLQSRADVETARILKESRDRVTKLLKDKNNELQRLAEALLEHETLTVKQIREAVEGRFVGGKGEASGHVVGDKTEGEEEGELRVPATVAQ